MESTIGSKAVGELVDIITRYTTQLLYGCGDSECTQVVCHSGDKNTSQKPVRRHKPRTARAAAITLASEPRPRARLCKYHQDANGKPEVSRNEGPRDPSSLIQLLCDTKSVRQLTATSLDNGLKPELEDLQHRNASLLRLLKSASRASPHPANDFVDDADLVDQLVQASFALLMRKLPPLTRAAPWIMINRDVISKGLACPQKNESMPSDDSYNPWAAILDTLNHKPYLRNLQIAMTVVGRRSHLEEELRRLDPQHALYPGPGCQPMAFLLATELCSINDTADLKSAQLSIFAVVVWLKRLFAGHWNSQPVFKPGTMVHGVLELLRHLHRMHKIMIKKSQTSSVPADAFELPLVNAQVDTLTMARSYLDWILEGSKHRHTMEYPFLFSMKQLSLYFRTMCHLEMREAHSLTDAAVMLRGRSGVHMEEDELSQQLVFAEQHYLLISVSRDKILEDTWTQLWQRRKGELSRPLRVRLGEASELEIGHDLGGVQIEFFNLVCREVFAEEAQMFATDMRSGISYFAVGSLQPLYMFELLGLVMALALYNGITLPIRLPKVLYTILSLSDEHSSHLALLIRGLQLQDLDDRWAGEVRSLHSILNDEIEDLEYSFPLEANGLRLSVRHPSPLFSKGKHDLQVSDMTLVDGGRPAIPQRDPSHLVWPGWRLHSAAGAFEDVTSENKAQYVQDYISHLCYGSVAPQLEAFLKGFHGPGLVHRKVLSIFQPHQLKSHLEGSDHLDIDELKAATRYDGYEAKSKYIQMFWRVISAWPETKQKLLLKFVTAAERIPITGAGQLTFVIKRAASENPDALPTSSTCFGTLMLPRYPSAEVLSAKLSLALMYGSEGFGTG